MKKLIQKIKEQYSDSAITKKQAFILVVTCFTFMAVSIGLAFSIPRHELQYSKKEQSAMQIISGQLAPEKSGQYFDAGINAAFQVIGFRCNNKDTVTMINNMLRNVFMQARGRIK